MSRGSTLSRLDSMQGSRGELSTFLFYLVSLSPESPVPPQCLQKGKGLIRRNEFKLRGKASFSIIVCVQITGGSTSPET